MVQNNSGFSDFVADGLMGLGFSGLSNNFPNVIDSLKQSWAISSAIFAIYLNTIGEFGNNTGYGLSASNLEIGEYDLGKYSSNVKILTSVQVNSSPGYWMSTADKITIEGYTV